MATLPDLDTTTVSFIAYWNALDQGGAGSINPDEVLSAAGVQSSTLYDNGVTGTYSIPGRTANFRVKEDGWFTVHIDRMETFGLQQGSRSNVPGPWDLVDWPSGEQTAAQSQLAQAINALQNELTAATNWNYGDVGLYNYQYQNATTLTFLTASNRGDLSLGAQYTADTDRFWHVFTGRVNNPSEYTHTISWEGTTIASDSDYGDEWGVKDILGDGDMPNAGVEYTGSMTSQFYSGTQGGNQKVAHMMALWA